MPPATAQGDPSFSGAAVYAPAPRGHRLPRTVLYDNNHGVVQQQGRPFPYISTIPHSSGGMRSSGMSATTSSSGPYEAQHSGGSSHEYVPVM